MCAQHVSCVPPSLPPCCCSRQDMQRRQAHNVLAAWRGRVLHRAQKRMKLLSALLYWEKGGQEVHSIPMCRTLLGGHWGS